MSNPLNILSNKIDVFPIAKPRANSSQRSNRLFYEETTSSLIRNMMDNVGFIVVNKDNTIPEIRVKYKQNNGVDTTQIESITLVNELYFNLYGYYFNIHSGADLTDLLNKNNITSDDKVVTIYAQIKLKRSKDTVPYEIEGQDESGRYTGLALCVSDTPLNSFVNEETTVDNNVSSTITVSLPLFTQRGTTFTLCENSYNKISATGINITGIDGKN